MQTVYRLPHQQHEASPAQYWLIAREHWLEACRRLNWTDVSAHVVMMDHLERPVTECDENLCVPRLSHAERALLAVRRKEPF